MKRHNILIVSWIYLLLISCGVGVDPNIDEDPPEIVNVKPRDGAKNVDTATKIEVTFSKNIDSATLPLAFIVKQGKEIVEGGSIAYNNAKAIFTPAIPLNSETLYQVVIAGSVTDIAGNFLKSERTWNFETGPPFGVVPRVSNTSPQNGANDVSLNQSIEIQFTVAMDIMSLQNIEVVYATDVESAIDGFIAYANKTMLFIPAKSWRAQKTVQVSLKNTLQNLSGKKLDSDYAFSFKTGTTHDKTSPQVISQSNIIASNSVISVMFDEAMDPSQFIGRSVQLREGGTALASLVNYYNQSVIIKPIKSLLPQVEYELVIADNVTDLAGNSISSQALQMSFLTGIGRDDIPPVIFDDYSPRADEVNVNVTAKVVVEFDELLNPLTVHTQNFELRHVENREAVAGMVSFINDDQPNESAIEFKPLERLQAAATYLVTITGMEDLAGNRLAEDFAWQFTTNIDTKAPKINTTSPSAEDDKISIALAHVLVEFDEPLDSNTVNQATVSVATVVTQVLLDGSVDYDSNNNSVKFTFAAGSDLEYDTKYVVTLSSNMTDVAGNPIEALSWYFTTNDGHVSPQVMEVLPAVDATNVNILLSSISATFDKILQVDSVNSETFQVLLNGEAVAGTVSLSDDGKVATFVFLPQSDLAFSTVYNIVLTSDISDLEGNTLSDFISSFTTQGQGQLAVFETKPTVGQSRSMPIDSSVSVTFRSSLDPVSVSNTTVFLEAATTGASIPVEVSLSPTDDKIIIINPQQNLDNNTTYTVIVTTAVIGTKGEILVEDYRDLSLTTEKEKIPLTIIARTPDRGAENVLAKSNVVVEFSEPVSIEFIGNDAITLLINGNRAWLGEVKQDENKRVLIFESKTQEGQLRDLKFSREYEVRVDYRIQDLAGNPLGTPEDLTDPQSGLVWRFMVEQKP